MSDVMEPVMGEKGCLPGCMTGKGCLIYLVVLAVVAFLASKLPVVMPEVSIPAEPIFTLPALGFAVTNTLLATWLTMLLLILGSILVTRNLNMVPSGVQNLVEWGLGVLLSLTENVAGERGRRFFPLGATIFIFLLVSNWMGILPGFASIGLVHEAHEGGHNVRELGVPGVDVYVLEAGEAGEHEKGWRIYSFL